MLVWDAVLWASICHIKHVTPLHALCEVSREVIPCSLDGLHPCGPSKRAQGKGSVRPDLRLKLHGRQRGQRHCLYYYLPHILVFSIQSYHCLYLVLNIY